MDKQVTVLCLNCRTSYHKDNDCVCVVKMRQPIPGMFGFSYQPKAKYPTVAQTIRTDIDFHNGSIFLD